MKKIINYSGIPVLILMAALVFMPFSCSKEAVKENPLTDNSSQLIKISGEDANAATKTILVNFATLWLGGTDKVGVYCAEAQEENGQENIPYTASSTAFSSAFTGSMTWGTGTHNFYAYYPYLAGSAAATVVPITLASAQTQSVGNNSAHIGALDFLVATPVSKTAGVVNASTTVDLRYNHVFTILEFQITGSGTLKYVKLVVPTNLIAFSGGTIDITLATPATGTAYSIAGQTGPSKEVVVTLTSEATLNATNATSVYMVINPGTQTGNCLIGLSSDGTTWNYISKVAPSGGFLRGKKYVVAIDQASAVSLFDQYNNVYSTVTSAGEIWLDRNLGATQVATSSTDAAAYGYLYQWGRGSDGHQSRSSLTITTLATDATSTPSNAWYGLFIKGGSDWLSSQNDNLWQDVSGVNNPCPSGFRIPTKAELETERLSWGVGGNNAIGAFGSPLKLPVAGGRISSTGSLYDVGSMGSYWSSTVDGTISYDLYIYSSGAYMGSSSRAVGFSVRCIKN